MSKKYYRVIKENFLWHVGAILENDGGEGYWPMDRTTLWDVNDNNGSEYISSRIIESSPEYFVQVFPVHLLKNTVFKLKEEARLMLSEGFKG